MDGEAQEEVIAQKIADLQQAAREAVKDWERRAIFRELDELTNSVREIKTNEGYTRYIRTRTGDI